MLPDRFTDSSQNDKKILLALLLNRKFVAKKASKYFFKTKWKQTTKNEIFEIISAGPGSWGNGKKIEGDFVKVLLTNSMRNLN